MDILGLGNCDQENKGVPIEGLLFKDGVGSEKLPAHPVVFLDHVVLVEKVNQV